MEDRIPLAAHIVVLALVIISALGAFIYFDSSKLYQFYVVIAAVLVNTAWSVFYHSTNKNLTTRLLVEYLLIGILVLSLFSWTLFS